MNQVEWQWFLRGQRLRAGDRVQVRANGIWLTGSFVPVNEGAFPTLSWESHRDTQGGAQSASGGDPLRSILLNTEMDLRRVDDQDQAPARLVLRAREAESPEELTRESA